MEKNTLPNIDYDILYLILNNYYIKNENYWIIINVEYTKNNYFKDKFYFKILSCYFFCFPYIWTKNNNHVLDFIKISE